MSPLFYRASPAVAARPTQTRPPGSYLWAASAGRLTRSGSGSILVSSGPWQTCWWWRTPSLRWDTVTIMTPVTWPVMQIQPRRGHNTWPSATCPPELGAANLFWCDKNVPSWCQCSHISLLSPPGVICITGLWILGQRMNDLRVWSAVNRYFLRTKPRYFATSTQSFIFLYQASQLPQGWSKSSVSDEL